MLERFRNRSALAVTLLLVAELRKRKPRPRCAVCGVLVEELELDTVPNDMFFHFTAHCHGQVDRVSIDKRFFMVAEDIEIGEVFVEGAPKRIEFDPNPHREFRYVGGTSND